MKRIYKIGEDVIVYDPGPEMIGFFREIDPSYTVQSIQPREGFIPRFQSLREKKFRVDELLFDMSLKQLKSMLASSKTDGPDAAGSYSYSGLDVLNVVVLKSLGECDLCQWDCKINRYQDQGKCGLGIKAFTSNPFIHIAEETPINPAVVINFAGCALRCRYCVEYQNWDIKNLTPANPNKLWTEVAGLLGQGIPVNSLEFTNPTESLAGLVGILNEAPSSYKLPVVLNCHLFGSRCFYEMASWIADVWLPDLRYGNDRCAKSLSGADNYMRHAKDGLEALLEGGAQVIVRMLVLPGHVGCCHQPAMELLSAYRQKVWVSVLDQYISEHEAHLDPNLKRRPSSQEISKVEALADRYGLRNVASGCDDFWAFS